MIFFLIFAKVGHIYCLHIENNNITANQAGCLLKILSVFGPFNGKRLCKYKILKKTNKIHCAKKSDTNPIQL